MFENVAQLKYQPNALSFHMLYRHCALYIIAIHATSLDFFLLATELLWEILRPFWQIA